MKLPDQAQWNALSKQQQTKVVRELNRHCPLSFDELRECSLGAISQRVAFFNSEDGGEFALILAGEVNLGFDSTGWQPNTDEMESWLDSQEEFGIADTINIHLDGATTPKRRCGLGPFLVETTAGEVGWEPISLNDKSVKQLIKGLPKGKRAAKSSFTSSDRSTRVVRDEKGQLTAEVAESNTHESLCGWMQARGFEFPSSDQWEYACGGGAESLFRWGDHAPCDCGPDDVSPEEAAWRQKWVLSERVLRYPAEGFEASFTRHRVHNAFGLRIAENPYNFEIVADHNTTRGGDGGSAVCGGVGFFVSWLTLATSYFEEEVCIIDTDDGLDIECLVGRRVFNLA